MSDPFEKIGTWIPVTDDMLVDAGVEVPGYAERVAREEAAAARARRALAWYVRLGRVVRFHWWRGREQFMGWVHRRLFPDHEDES